MFDFEKARNCLCGSPECNFYTSGALHNCGLPDALKKGFQLRDMSKLQEALDSCHCQNPVLLEAYERLAHQKPA